MLLTVYERLVLGQILSEPGVEADLTTLRVVRKLREVVGFTEEEHAALNLRAGQDWSKCPRCKGEAIEFPNGKADLSQRRCITCGYEGPEGVGSLFWNRDVPQEAEIEIGKKAAEVVKGRLEMMDKAGKLIEERHFTLCDKFGVNPELVEG
jgi:hypothetical protein